MSQEDLNATVPPARIAGMADRRYRHGQRANINVAASIFAFSLLLILLSGMNRTAAGMPLEEVFSVEKACTAILVLMGAAALPLWEAGIRLALSRFQAWRLAWCAASLVASSALGVGGIMFVFSAAERLPYATVLVGSGFLLFVALRMQFRAVRALRIG